MTLYERLLAEKKELEFKYQKLISFLASDKIDSLELEQIDLMHIQSTIMQAYSQVLATRISLLTLSKA